MGRDKVKKDAPPWGELEITQEKLAEEMGMSRQALNLMEKRALQKMKKLLEKRKIKKSDDIL